MTVTEVPVEALPLRGLFVPLGARCAVCESDVTGPMAWCWWDADAGDVLFACEGCMAALIPAPLVDGPDMTVEEFDVAFEGGWADEDRETSFVDERDGGEW